MKWWYALLYSPCWLFSALNVSYLLDAAHSSHLMIHIPPAFETSWTSSDETSYEFKLRNESLDNWSEIITIECIPRYPSMLDFYLRKHKIAMETLFATHEIDRSEMNSTHEHHTPVGYAYYRHMHYRTQTQDVDPQFKESMGMKLVQGHSALYRIAYNIKYPYTCSPTPFEEKIHTFLHSCQVVIKD